MWNHLIYFMTRSQRISKLSNAIKAYRGRHVPAPGGKRKWLHSPQLARRADIVRHLVELGRTQEQIELDAMMIDSFSHVSQFEQWIKSFETKSALDSTLEAERAAT